MAGSSPTTHASRPGSITYAWPGLYVLLRAVFVGDVQRARDDDADVMQLSVPATGLMHSDHFQPGCMDMRDALVPPIRTMSTVVLSSARVSVVSGQPARILNPRSHRAKPPLCGSRF